MIHVYSNAGDAADSARGSAMQAMVDARFGAADAARMEYLNIRCKETVAELTCRVCGNRMYLTTGRRIPGVCGRPACKRKARKEAACPTT